MSEGSRSGAWAARLIRDTYGFADRQRNEAFLENALLVWLEPEHHQRRFLAALGNDVDAVAEVSFSPQSHVGDAGRVDISFTVDDDAFNVELKLWAPLTPAQRRKDYANVFLVPRARTKSVRAEVYGTVVSWEELFARLADDGSQRSDELDRLTSFYAGLAFGAGVVEWPADDKGALLTEFRTTGRALLTELLQSEGQYRRLSWTPDAWFELSEQYSGDKISLDLSADPPWWTYTEDDGWESDLGRGALAPESSSLAAAFVGVWNNVARIGLGMSGHGKSELRLDDDEGWVFGRWLWCGEFAVEVMLTFGDHDDSRVVGLMIWKKDDGGWRFIRDAWWPKSRDSAFDDWSKEAVVAAMRCGEGDVDEAFVGLRHAVTWESA